MLLMPLLAVLQLVQVPVHLEQYRRNTIKNQLLRDDDVRMQESLCRRPQVCEK